MIGAVVGNFNVVSRLGRGGMGEVYLAEQQSIGTRVAIKFLLPEISKDTEHVRRFFNEARAVSRIQHAGIVKIFDVGFHASGHAYLVMEYLEGEPLSRRIARHQRVPIAQIGELGRQIASVLEATHSAGITHRDLKPDNIYLISDRELASRERVKILDFGIAKLTGTLAHASPPTSGTMGTPAYMAPEQWGDSSKVDWRADAYSLGCLAFEMTCGRPPFIATTIAEACAKHLSEPPPLARSLRPDAPIELEQLLAQLMAKDPAQRPASMEHVARAFEAIAAAAPVPSASAPTAAAQSSPTASEVPVTLAPTAASLPPPSSPAPTAASLPHAAVSPVPTAASVGPVASVHATARPRRSRRTIMIVASILVVATAGTVVMATRHGSHGLGVFEPPTGPGWTPLAGSSTEPVTLRYKFAPGDKTTVTISANTAQHLVADDIDFTATLVFAMTGEITWTAATADQFTGELRVTHAKIDSVSDPIDGGRKTEEHWSSDDRGSTSRFRALAASLDKPIPIVISSRGDLVSTGAHSAAPVSGLDGIAGSDVILRYAFVPLPEAPVAVGDHWDGGASRLRLQQGEMRFQPQFAVAGISGDRRTVLMTAQPDLAIDFGKAVGMTTEATAARFWLLFDTKLGEITNSWRGMKLRFAIDNHGDRGEMDLDIAMTYAATRVRTGDP